jgi:hypothetical protein
MGHAQIDTYIKKFGTGSIMFDGTDDYLSIPDSDDWYFGTGDFTIDFWARFYNPSTSGQHFVSQLSAPTARFDLYWSGSRIQVEWWDGAVSPKYYSAYTDILSLNADQFYHIALVRNGATLYIFLDGISLNVNSSNPLGSNDVGNISANLCIGCHGSSLWFRGWIDEFRISKGIARWVSNFTPPTGEYTD